MTSGTDAHMPHLKPSAYDLSGLIDPHIHTAPDVSPRRVTDLQAARQARAAGMRAILLKSHVTCTAGRAALASEAVPGVQVLGGLALNEPIGGLNPHAVDAALRLGARVIWMPTRDAARSRCAKGQEGGIQLLDREGSLVPQLDPILEQIRDAGAVLGTGHLSLPEIAALLARAQALGLPKIVVTHPESRSSRIPSQIQQELAREGIWFERCFLPVYNGQCSMDALAANIRVLGCASTLLSTDLGQRGSPTPVEGFRLYLSQLEQHGFAAPEIERMAGQTAAELLDL